MARAPSAPISLTPEWIMSNIVLRSTVARTWFCRRESASAFAPSSPTLFPTNTVLPGESTNTEGEQGVVLSEGCCHGLRAVVAQAVSHYEGHRG